MNTSELVKLYRTHPLAKPVFEDLRNSAYDPECSDLTRMSRRLRERKVNASVGDVREFFELLEHLRLGEILKKAHRTDAVRFQWKTAGVRRLVDEVRQTAAVLVSQAPVGQRPEVPQTQGVPLPLKLRAGFSLTIPEDATDMELSRIQKILEAYKSGGK